MPHSHSASRFNKRSTKESWPLSLQGCIRGNVGRSNAWEEELGDMVLELETRGVEVVVGAITVGLCLPVEAINHWQVPFT